MDRLWLAGLQMAKGNAKTKFKKIKRRSKRARNEKTGRSFSLSKKAEHCSLIDLRESRTAGCLRSLKCGKLRQTDIAARPSYNLESAISTSHLRVQWAFHRDIATSRDLRRISRARISWRSRGRGPKKKSSTNGQGLTVAGGLSNTSKRL